MLRRILDVLFWIGAGLYFGGMVTLGAVVAPAVFDAVKRAQVSMPGVVSPPLEMDRQVGGEVFGVILDRFTYVEGTCLAIMLVVLAAWIMWPQRQRVVPRSLWWMLVLWVVMAGLMVYDLRDIRPQVFALRQQVRNEAAAHVGDAAGVTGSGWPAREAFDVLHRQSERVGHGKVYAVLVLMILAAWRGSPRGTEARARHETMWKTWKRERLRKGQIVAKESLAAKGKRTEKIIGVLEKLYPDATCALVHQNAFELLVATILSAQCTDVRVNMVTPVLFKKYPTPAALAKASQEDVEKIIQSTGFFRNKAKSIRESAADIVEKHGGKVPETMEALTNLRGVGRKTANVVLGNAFSQNVGVVVDTHVGRLSLRLGLTKETNPEKVEQDLMVLVRREKWTLFSHLLIFHGRRICEARKPKCGECALLGDCPEGKRRMKGGPGRGDSQ